MKQLLEADGIQLAFGEKKILTDVYIRIEPGRLTGLLGRNGSGKTCLLNTIYGSLVNEDKCIRINGERLRLPFMRPNLIRYLPQFFFIPKTLTLARVFLDFETTFATFENDFPECRLRPEQKISELSGGMRRLVEIFCLLRSRSQFLLLDEPFTHIMPIHIEKIKTILQTEKNTRGILITDHLYEHLTEICDPLYLLANGKTWLAREKQDLQRLGYIR